MQKGLFSHYSIVLNFGKAFNVPGQFFLIGPSHKVKGQHFKCPFGSLSTGPQGNQHAGNQSTVDLQGDTIVGLCQKVFTSQNAFEPAEKQLNLPPVPVQQDYGFSRKVHTVGNQQQAVISLGSTNSLFA